MTIEYRKGNIFEVTKGIIAHGCNCSGGFGSGIAGQIARRYPSVVDFYNVCFSEGDCILGEYSIVSVTDKLYIANLYTQQSFGSDGKRYADIDAINTALSMLLENCSYDRYCTKVHVPAIGCGLGGLDWETEVKPLYEEIGTTYDFVVYEPW